MYRLLQALTGLILLLIPLGGLYFSYPVIKFEIGSVSPFVLLIGALCLYGWIFKKTWFFSYKRDLRRLVARLLTLRNSTQWLLTIGTGLLLADLFRHWSFQTSLYDMVYTHSVMMHPWHDGHWGHCALSPLRSFFVDHFAPTMLLGSLLVSWAKSSELIILLQILLVMGGCWTLVRMGPTAKRPRLWTLATFVVLCSRSLVRPGVDLREEHFAFFFLCAGIASLHQKRLGLYFLTLLLYVGSKEHTPILGLGLLFPLLWDHSLDFSRPLRIRLAIATAALCLGYAALIYGHIIPTLQAPTGQVVSQITQRLPNLGSSLSEIALSPLLRPVQVFQWIGGRLLDPSSMRYLAFLLIPLVPFCIPLRGRAWIWVLAASIGIAANIIPTRPEQRSFHWHYELAFAPFLLTALLAGIRQLPQLRHWKWGLAIALLFSMRWPAFEAWKSLPSQWQIRDAFAFRSVPCDQAIGADIHALPHLVQCPRLQLLRVSDCNDAAQTLKSLLADPGPPGVPGETLKGADRILLDRKENCQLLLEKRVLQPDGSMPIWSSPSGRYVLYPLKAPATASYSD
jgi:uncharacterized membrane protein